ncbi:hypothetical protein EYZ11_012449 [Aspergillus tanneri]|uniref:Delta(24(24(1)))-sterol reductase n=1 Tax=Aspergillus tanneri TaxID=1220188 RepID=A0A4S3J086_9EURO|nr:hypothetical protein EYZ11_012449 [Aspergillus tanneri]
MFYEVRIPWFLLFGCSCAAAKQYEQFGYVSGEVLFLVLAHYACAKGEQLTLTTWDIHQEKFRFMLIFWNMANVPMTYCHGAVFLASRHPATYAWDKTALALLDGHVKRRTFPHLPWQEVHNPRTIATDCGEKILIDGWYTYARAHHGLREPVPWFYAVFFWVIVAHRTQRDVAKCR